MAAQPDSQGTLSFILDLVFFYGSQWFFKAFRAPFSKGEISAYKTLQKVFRANGPSTVGSSNGILAHKQNAALGSFSETRATPSWLAPCESPWPAKQV